VIVPKDHPLGLKSDLNLRDIAEYPVITYHEGFTGRSQIDKAFSREGITPDIVMSALDADVIKAYVELGLGVGIVASIAISQVKDESLLLLDSRHLFHSNTALIGVRRGHYLRGFAYRFIELCSDQQTESQIKALTSV
jgi:LysR family cys regulon transcriptional activator